MKQNRRSFLKSSATATSATVFAGLINTPGVANSNTTAPGTTQPGTTQPGTTVAHPTYTAFEFRIGVLSKPAASGGSTLGDPDTELKWWALDNLTAADVLAGNDVINPPAAKLKSTVDTHLTAQYWEYEGINHFTQANQSITWALSDYSENFNGIHARPPAPYAVVIQASTAVSPAGSAGTELGIVLKPTAYGWNVEGAYSDAANLKYLIAGSVPPGSPPGTPPTPPTEAPPPSETAQQSGFYWKGYWQNNDTSGSGTASVMWGFRVYFRRRVMIWSGAGGAGYVPDTTVPGASQTDGWTPWESL